MPVFLVFLLVSLAATGARMILDNYLRQQAEKKDAAGQLKVPTAEAGGPIPVWFGTAEVAPNTVWWGNTMAAKHLQWFYSMSAHLVLGWGLVNEILDIRFGGKSCRNKGIGGDRYLCTVAHTNHEPPNASYWTLLLAGTPSTWQGQWSATEAYIIGDAVAHGDAQDIVIPGALENAGSPLDVTVAGNYYARSADRADALFGGDAAQGGVGSNPISDGSVNKGKMRVYWGADAQVIDAYLSSAKVYGANCSRWPQLAYIRMGHEDGTPFYIAAGSGVPPAMTVIARRTAWWETTLSPLGQSAADATIRYDASVPEILYALLTHKGYGLGRDPATIDIPSFTAVAAALLAEPITATKTGFGLSVHIADTTPAEQTIARILQHVGAVLTTNPLTQKVTLKLIRGDYDVATLPHVTPANATGLRYAPGTWNRTFNEIRITYQHFENTPQYRGFAPDVVTDQDLANFQATGRIRSQTIDLPYITDPDIAALCCARTRRAMSVPLAQVSWKMNREGYALAKGDVVVVDWPAFGIDGLVVRLTRANYGKLEDGEISFDGAADVFAATHSTFPAQGDTASSSPTAGATDSSGTTPPAGAGAIVWGSGF
jgi:Putative phage tail protein